MLYAEILSRFLREMCIFSLQVPCGMYTQSCASLISTTAGMQMPRSALKDVGKCSWRIVLFDCSAMNTQQSYHEDFTTVSRVLWAWRTTGFTAKCLDVLSSGRSLKFLYFFKNHFISIQIGYRLTKIRFIWSVVLWSNFQGMHTKKSRGFYVALGLKFVSGRLPGSLFDS